MKPTDRVQWLKDALFQDDLLVTYVGEHGLDVTLDDLLALKSSVVDQLKAGAGGEEWRNKATAIVIRVKGRVKLLREVREGTL